MSPECSNFLWNKGTKAHNTAWKEWFSFEVWHEAGEERGGTMARRLLEASSAAKGSRLPIYSIIRMSNVVLNH